MSETVPPPSNLPPPQPTGTPQAPTAPAPTPSAETGSRGTILQLPPNVSELPAGERLPGVVTSRPSASQFIVTTRLGAITVQSEAAPSLGTRVLLQTTAQGPQPSVRILPQGSPPPAPQPTLGTLPGSQGLTAQTAQIAPPATNTAPRPAAAIIPDGPSQIRGSVVSASIVRTSGDAARSPLAGSDLRGGGEARAEAPIRPGSRLAVRIAAIARPGTTAPPAAPATNTVTGTVTGTDISGNVLVRTNSAELALTLPRPLAIGSNLLLQVVSRPVPFIPTSATPHGLATAARWEALHDALQGSLPPAVQNAVSQAVPQPGGQFTGALMFFIAALRAGDLRGLFGADAKRMIERDAALGRMIEEFGVMQRLASEPGGQEWRLFLIPVLSDEQLHQMRLFVRDRHGDGGDDEKSKETRFVIEVTFSKLGPFQFDGLARPNSLNLIIRTEQEITATMKREITTIFQDTTAALGLNGSVTFRMEDFFELQPLKDSGLADDQGIIA